MVTASVLDGLTSYEFLLRLSAGGRRALRDHARSLRAEPALFRQEGDTCESVSLISAGELRVGKRRTSGREMVLYTVGPGEICVIEALAVLCGTRYRAEAVIERPVTGVAVPAEAFRKLVDTEPHVRAFLFRAFEARLAMALDLVGDFALATLEARLAGLLLRHARTSADVQITHERLAHELACGREAVSRTLGAWERAGIVLLGRAHLRVRDTAKLAALAGR